MKFKSEDSIKNTTSIRKAAIDECARVVKGFWIGWQNESNMECAEIILESILSLNEPGRESSRESYPDNISWPIQINQVYTLKSNCGGPWGPKEGCDKVVVTDARDGWVRYYIDSSRSDERKKDEDFLKLYSRVFN